MGADLCTPHYYIFKNRPLLNEHVRAINVTVPKCSMGPIWGPDSGPKNGPHSMSTNSWWTPQEDQILVHQADPILNRFRKKSLKFHKPRISVSIYFVCCPFTGYDLKAKRKPRQSKVGRANTVGICKMLAPHILRHTHTFPHIPRTNPAPTPTYPRIPTHTHTYPQVATDTHAYLLHTYTHTPSLSPCPLPACPFATWVSN